MNYYFVIHDVHSFLQHNDWIGKQSETITADFRRLSPHDRIVYYCREDQVITGTFEIASKSGIIEYDKKWEGRHIVASIKPLNKAKPPYYVPANQMLQDIPEPLSLFPDRKLKGITLRGRTLVPITSSDFDQIDNYIKSYKPRQKLFKGPSNDAGLGEPRDYKVMNYAPTSEQGVVALFVGHMKALGFEKLEFIRQGFPDACAIQKSGLNYERKFIEFEYKSSGFRQHVNNPKHCNIRCDYVVCWEHNYLTCPVEVIEIRSRMEEIIRGQSPIS
jgi:hypothetical protein